MSAHQKEIGDLCFEAYSALECLGQDISAMQHRVYYMQDKVDFEALELWRRDVRGVQRRLDEVFKIIEAIGGNSER